MKTEKYYYLAIRKRNNEQDHFFLNKSFSFQELKINCYGRYWLADPFLFERDHKVYLFFEAYDLLAKRGKIGYSLIKENGECTPVRIALSRSYHMSFPYIFQWNNDIYMMPETCGNNSVQLFKAVNFPNKWEEAGMILSDVFVCDSIFLKFKEKVNLLVSEMYHGKAPNGKLFSCWVKNKVFSFDQKGLIKNKAGGGNETDIVLEGDYGVRNGGAAFKLHDSLIRVGQDCTDNLYGKGLVFWKVLNIEPYQEEELYSITCDEMKNNILYHSKFTKDGNLVGVHTYNLCKKYEIIDFSILRRKSWCVSISSFFYRACRKLIKCCRCLLKNRRLSD